MASTPLSLTIISTPLSLTRRRDDAHRDFDSAQSDDEKDQFNLKSTQSDDEKDQFI